MTPEETGVGVIASGSVEFVPAGVGRGETTEVTVSVGAGLASSVVVMAIFAPEAVLLAVLSTRSEGSSGPAALETMTGREAPLRTNFVARSLSMEYCLMSNEMRKEAMAAPVMVQ